MMAEKGETEESIFLFNRTFIIIILVLLILFKIFGWRYASTIPVGDEYQFGNALIACYIPLEVISMIMYIRGFIIINRSIKKHSINEYFEGIYLLILGSESGYFIISHMGLKGFLSNFLPFIYLIILNLILLGVFIQHQKLKKFIKNEYLISSPYLCFFCNNNLEFHTYYGRYYCTGCKRWY